MFQVNTTVIVVMHVLRGVLSTRRTVIVIARHSQTGGARL